MKHHHSWRWLLWQQHERHYAFVRKNGHGRLMAVAHAVAWLFKRRR